jgi:hypothetical protein
VVGVHLIDRIFFSFPNTLTLCHYQILTIVMSEAISQVTNQNSPISIAEAI